MLVQRTANSNITNIDGAMAMDNILGKLLQRAKTRTMTLQEQEEQRVNFAYGNAAEDDHGSTIETVRAAAIILKADK